MRAAFSSALIHRLSLEFPIQSNPSPYTKRITHHNVRSKKRARKGGARGGKAGFVTPSAFPPRKPAHRSSVPLKGKRPLPKCPLKRKTPSAQERTSDARQCTISGTIFSLILSIVHSLVYYKEHTSNLLTLKSESVILWSS